MEEPHPEFFHINPDVFHASDCVTHRNSPPTHYQECMKGMSVELVETTQGVVLPYKAAQFH